MDYPIKKPYPDADYQVCDTCGQQYTMKATHCVQCEKRDKMNNLPQQVTERYVSNLIHYGRNKEFEIVTLNRQHSKLGEDVVGVYYHVAIDTVTGVANSAAGATVNQAVRRALEKHGVTFR